MSLNQSLLSEIQKLAPSSIIELFELDCTGIGGDILRFHAGTNQVSQNIVWQGNTYVRYPITVSGFDFTTQTQFPRPKLQVSNIFSAITTIVMAHNDLMGAKLTRRRTLAKFLDAVNFASGTNVNADPTAEFPHDVYFIDRKSSENKDVVEFELAASTDLVGVSLPRRQIVQNVCIWQYRGPECGFTGPPVLDINDNPIPTASTTAGQAVINTYNAITAATANLAVAEAALSAASQARDSACSPVLLSTQFSFSGTGFPTYGVYVYGSLVRAFWNGSAVTLGAVYAQGALRLTNNTGVGYSYYYEIQQYGVDSGTCTPATSAYTSALSARDAAQTALNTANTNHQAALAALPANDPIYLVERCGKRLSSCKLRFGTNAQLPFGSFPSVGLTK